MRFDHTNRLWLATTHGLIFRDNGQWHVYSTTNSNLPTNYIYSIDFDSQNNVWCGTFGAGLTCFNGTSFTTYTTKQGLESDFVATVCVDKNDVVWFNCRSCQYPEIYGLGLSSLHNGQFKTYTANNSQLASNTIWDIETDAKTTYGSPLATTRVLHSSMAHIGTYTIPTTLGWHSMKQHI